MMMNLNHEIVYNIDEFWIYIYFGVSYHQFILNSKKIFFYWVNIISLSEPLKQIQKIKWLVFIPSSKLIF